MTPDLVVLALLALTIFAGGFIAGSAWERGTVDEVLDELARDAE